MNEDTPELAPLPWSQENDLSVVKDANGVTVSFAQNAPRIVKGMNMQRAAIELLDRMAKTIRAATSPTASGTETAQLIAQAAIAGELVRQARMKS